jgi:hypothetical protein
MDERPVIVRPFAFVLGRSHFSFSLVSFVGRPFGTCGLRARSTKPPDEVEFEAGQWSADFMHCSTRYERSEVNSHNSGTVDQLDH